MFRNILVAIDRSPSAWRAFEHATDLAQALHARLTIASVVEPMPLSAYGAAAPLAELEEEADHDVVRLLRRAVDSVPRDVPVTSVLRHGRPSDEIIRLIHEGDHDLVVVGSRDRGRARSRLFGSVASDLHYAALVPILVVHHDREPTPIRPVGS